MIYDLYVSLYRIFRTGIDHDFNKLLGGNRFYQDEIPQGIISFPCAVYNFISESNAGIISSNSGYFTFQIRCVASSVEEKAKIVDACRDMFNDAIISDERCAGVIYLISSNNIQRLSVDHPFEVTLTFQVYL